MKSLAVDRPLNGYLLAFNYFLLGDNVFFWHLYAYLFKLAGGFILFFTILKLWPKNLQIITLITLLFLLYPGYLQQTLPLGFVNWTITLDIWILSLFFTISAIKTIGKFKHVIFTLLSIFFQVNVLLQLEFFIGLELLRVMIINYLIGSKLSFKNIKKTLVYFIPYLFCILGFLFWRVLIFKPTREVTDINWVTQYYYSNPLWLIQLPLELIYSFAQTLFGAFFITIAINFVRLPLVYSVISVLIGIVSSFIFFLYLRKTNFAKISSAFGREIFIIGVFSALASLVPIIIAGRTVRIFSVLDRYTLTVIISVAFILTGLMLYKLPVKIFKFAAVVLIFLSVTSHLMNGFWHKVLWDNQKNLWWQLYWRAPKIEDQSMLILNFPKLSEGTIFNKVTNKLEWQRFYWAEEQIWSAGNLFLNYNNPPQNHFHGDFLMDSGVLEKINKGDSETFNNRTILYTRDYTKSIIIDTPSDVSCLKVLGGENLIKQGPNIFPPVQIFGSEPAHNWCYFFQKASLSRQLNDWDQLASIRKEVVKKNLKPQNPDEWLVFDTNLR